jgi:type II secretory pathway component PulF
MKINLPLPTKTLFTISLFFNKNVLFILPTATLIFVFLLIILQSQPGKKFLSRLISILPYSKTLFNQLDLTRFNRTLSTLLKSAVPITQALRVSTRSLTLPKFRKLTSIFEEEIKKGVSLSSILKRQKIFPSVMVRMIVAGEKSGTLDSILSDLADFYEQEVDASLKNFVNLLEPLLMLIVGAAVGAMVLLVIAPIYNLIGGLQTQGPFK